MGRAVGPGMLTWLALLASVFATTGCAVLEGDPYQLESATIGTPLERALVFDREAPLRGVAVDAKQRFVWSPRIMVRTLADDGNGGVKPGVERRSIVCAEPSPDALTAISNVINAELRRNRPQGDGSAGETSASLAGSLSETAQEIGSRTQVVQLLRDALYRACEAYANGALDDFGYSVILGQIDLFMLQLLSVDVLGRARGREEVAEKREARDQKAVDVTRLEGELRLAQQRTDRLEQDLKTKKAADEATALLQTRQKSLEARQTSLRDRKAELEGSADQAGSIAHTREALAAITSAEEEAEQLRNAAEDAEAEANALGAGSPDRASKEQAAQDARTRHEEAKRAAAIKASNREFLTDKFQRDEKEQQGIVTELRDVETELAGINQGLAAPPSQTNAAPPDSVVNSAREKVSGLRAELAAARTNLATAEAELARATEGAGPGPAEVHALTNLIETSFLAAQAGGLPGRVTQIACLQWFARNPQVTMPVPAKLKLDKANLIVLNGKVPAIAGYCHEFLQLKTDKPLAREIREFQLKRSQRDCRPKPGVRPDGDCLPTRKLIAP